ncbi:MULTISPECIES: hypothetical protein, partial [unclassified Bradyrhizobium]
RQFVLETDGVHDETTADFFNGIGQKRSYDPLTACFQSAPGADVASANREDPRGDVSNRALGRAISALLK